MPRKREEDWSDEDQRKLERLKYEVGLGIEAADRGEFSDRTLTDIAREVFGKFKKERQ